MHPPQAACLLAIRQDARYAIAATIDPNSVTSQIANNVPRPESLDLARSLNILRAVPPSSALYRRTRELLDNSLETEPEIPKATPRGERKFLTIGMATRDDYDGCYFTIQAIRLYHPEILDDVEFLLIDNNPAGPCGKPLKALEGWAPNYRYIPHRSRQGTALRDLIFREAAGDFVLCVDSHVFFPAGALARLIGYFRSHPDTKDLVQGPLVGDDFKPMGTCFQPVWSYGMYGIWGLDERGIDVDAPPFEILMQGLGAFACRRDAWPGFNPRLAGFGGEEGYIHEKIRRAGGRNLCLPFLRWMHRFERPMGVRYGGTGYADRIRNYLLIYDELGLDPQPVVNHFREFAGGQETQAGVAAAQAEIASPFHFFDVIYAVTPEGNDGPWQKTRRRFRTGSISLGVRRFFAADTPLNRRIGHVLSHRRIIEEARLQQLKSVLVFDDELAIANDSPLVATLSREALENNAWQVLHLKESDKPAQAIAYRSNAYDELLTALPDNATDVALWLLGHQSLESFLGEAFPSSPSFAIPPSAADESDRTGTTP